MRWMVEARIALPLRPLGIPVMPRMHTSTTTTIKIVFQRKFRFISKSFPIRPPSGRSRRPASRCAMRRLLLFPLHVRDGAAQDLHFELVGGHAQVNRIVLDADDGAANAAGGDHAVAVLERRMHFLNAALAALRRQDQQEIE